MSADTPFLMGQSIRIAREQRGWTQAELARRVGVSRQWIISLEQGSPNARLGLVLSTLGHLDLTIDLRHSPPDPILAAIAGIEVS